MFLPIILGAFVGLSLGLTGGGGSILGVPLLVYGLGLELRRAVAMSLAVVGLTALYGAIIQGRRGQVLWKAGAILGLGGITAAPLGALVGEWLADDVALYLFALLMAVVGSLTLYNPSKSAEIPLDWIACRRDSLSASRFTWRCAAKLAAAGALTGVLSGAFGVGGGFLVVPALLVVLKVEMDVALATSLVSIFLVAASGLAANSTHLHRSDLAVAIAFLVGAAAGMTGGTQLKQYLSGPVLKTVFGWAIIGTAGFMVVQTLMSS